MLNGWCDGGGDVLIDSSDRTRDQQKSGEDEKWLNMPTQVLVVTFSTKRKKGEYTKIKTK